MEKTLPEQIDSYFGIKVKNLWEDVEIDANIYNNKKVTTTDEFFVDFYSVKSCKLSLKSKTQTGLIEYLKGS